MKSLRDANIPEYETHLQVKEMFNDLTEVKNKVVNLVDGQPSQNRKLYYNPQQYPNNSFVLNKINEVSVH